MINVDLLFFNFLAWQAGLRVEILLIQPQPDRFGLN